MEMTEQDRIELVLTRQVAPKLSEITSKLQQINSNMDHINAQFLQEKNTHTQEIREVADAVENVRKILNGNGKLGLVAEVSNLKTWIEDQKKLQWILIAAVVGELVGLGFVIVKFVLTLP